MEKWGESENLLIALQRRRLEARKAVKKKGNRVHVAAVSIWTIKNKHEDKRDQAVNLDGNAVEVDI